ncbi:MAG: hypothetical protein LUF04_12155, partial [Bacteroides sp.]|nr:hypothetical protein [Bacteroides sp.]
VAPNGGGVIICIVNDITLVVFGRTVYPDSYPFEFHLQDYNHIFVDMEDRSPEGKEYYTKMYDEYLGQKNSCISIGIQENYAIVYPRKEDQ